MYIKSSFLKLKLFIKNNDNKSTLLYTEIRNLSNENIVKNVENYSKNLIITANKLIK